MASRSLTAQRRESTTVHPFPSPSMVAIVLGAQWGDEVSETYCDRNVFHIEDVY